MDYFNKYRIVSAWNGLKDNSGFSNNSFHRHGSLTSFLANLNISKTSPGLRTAWSQVRTFWMSWPFGNLINVFFRWIWPSQLPALNPAISAYGTSTPSSAEATCTPVPTQLSRASHLAPRTWVFCVLDSPTAQCACLTCDLRTAAWRCLRVWPVTFWTAS